MSQLTVLHWVYVIVVLVVLAVMIMRRDTVLPCILGLIVFGWVAKGGVVGAISTVFTALVASGGVFWEIVVVISLVVAMSKALADVGADYLIMQPAARLMVNPHIAFWVLGLGMMVVSWFVWPTPAVALIGAIMLPVAIRAGLPSIGAAISMNIFGHGIALSTDYVIQGAPGITASAAGFESASSVIGPSIPLFVTMAVVTTVLAYMVVRKSLREEAEAHEEERKRFAEEEAKKQAREFTFTSYLIAVLVPLLFILDVVAMLVLELRGGEATALIGGTAAFIMALGAISQFGMESLEKITDYVRDGFMFGIKIFAPVVVIGGFFFLGSGEIMPQIVGEVPYAVSKDGILADIGTAMAGVIPLTRIPVSIMELIIGAITGLDGSGFSGLPLVGSLARTFGTAANTDTGTLAALGQFASVWIGGGTVVPWGLIPVAAICGVEPFELARRNFYPVVIGLIVTTIVAIIIM